MWNLETSIEFIKDLEKFLGGQFHVGLIGGVLQNGSSSKDLDICIFPDKKDAYLTSRDRFYAARFQLRKYGLTQHRSFEETRRHWSKTYGSNDIKMVEVWLTKDNKRVDIFYLE